MNDALHNSVNSPAGRLAEILIKKLSAGDKGVLPPELQARFDRLFDASGHFGKLARVRLAAEASFLFERAPKWTTERIVPLFDWSSSEAMDAWMARKYSNYIGSPQFIGLTKIPFLALFERDLPDEDLRIFAEWLAAMLLAKQANRAEYPISSTEARSALRKAGVRSLSSVAHRLAVEMERATTDQKIHTWLKVVGPVFESIWPLD